MMQASYQLPVDPGALASIYGAAVSEQNWPDTLDICTGIVGARSAVLVSVDAIDPHDYSINVLGKVLREQFTSEVMQHWKKHYGELDRDGHVATLRHPAQRILHGATVFGIPNQQLRQRGDSVFLQQTAGIGDKLIARLNDIPRYVDNVVFQFPISLQEVPATAFVPFQALLPHLAKAVEMGQLFGRLRRRYQAVLAALDHVGLGLCVVDERGRLIVANSEAERIIDAGNGLKRTSAGGLGCRNAEEHKRLERAISLASLSRQKELTRAQTILALRNVSENESVLIECSPLSDHLSELEGSGGEVLVQLIDVASLDQCSVDAFAVLYRLTAAEREVAQLMLNGLSNVEIAESRNTSVQTTKSQVAGIMSKSRVNSRVTLARRILRTDPPIGRGV